MQAKPPLTGHQDEPESRRCHAKPPIYLPMPYSTIEETVACLSASHLRYQVEFACHMFCCGGGNEEILRSWYMHNYAVAEYGLQGAARLKKLGLEFPVQERIYRITQSDTLDLGLPDWTREAEWMLHHRALLQQDSLIYYQWNLSQESFELTPDERAQGYSVLFQRYPQIKLKERMKQLQPKIREAVKCREQREQRTA